MNNSQISFLAQRLRSGVQEPAPGGFHHIGFRTSAGIVADFVAFAALLVGVGLLIGVW
jgi:hypothetical protein